MTKWGIIFFVILVIVLIAGFMFIIKNGLDFFNSDVSLSPMSAGSTEQIGDLIRVFSPPANAIIAPDKPLKLEGEARGNWYFEASFTYEIIGADDRELALGFVQADGDWMTENFVPFSEEITFEYPTAAEAVLILKNANPSGLPEHERSLEIPVKFNLETTVVKVYFGNRIADPGATDCNKTFAVERKVVKTPQIAQFALWELLKGPTPDEEANGYFTLINPGVKLLAITIDDKGNALTDFSAEIEETVGGSCRVAGIASQIQGTLLQFPTVKKVTIAVEGRTGDVLQP